MKAGMKLTSRSEIGMLRSETRQHRTWDDRERFLNSLDRATYDERP